MEDSNYDPGSIALAFYSGIYAFGGANSLNYMTEELKNPNRCHIYKSFEFFN